MFRLYVFLMSVHAFSTYVQAQVIWSFEFMPGMGLAVPSSLSIRQEDHPELKFRTSWKTESFQFPLYYSYRLSRYKNGKGWELEMNHLKLRAKDLPAEVQHFSITHGFNHIWLNHALITRHFTWKIGAGVVLAHPENSVRGRKLDGNRGINGTGYYIGGPTIHTGIQRRINLAKHFFLPIEGKISFAYTHVPVEGGRARVPVVALHLLTGLGLRTKQKK